MEPVEEESTAEQITITQVAGPVLLDKDQLEQQNRYGEIPGIKVGTIFHKRKEISHSGIHRPFFKRFHCGPEGLYSVVLTGRIVKENDDSFDYIGQECPISATKYCKQIQSLIISSKSLLPIRVVRFIREPFKKYCYNGLFVITNYWCSPSKKSKARKVFRFRFSKYLNNSDIQRPFNQSKKQVIYTSKLKAPKNNNENNDVFITAVTFSRIQNKPEDTLVTNPFSSAIEEKRQDCIRGIKEHSVVPSQTFKEEIVFHSPATDEESVLNAADDEISAVQDDLNLSAVHSTDYQFLSTENTTNNESNAVHSNGVQFLSTENSTLKYEYYSSSPQNTGNEYYLADEEGQFNSLTSLDYQQAETEPISEITFDDFNEVKSEFGGSGVYLPKEEQIEEVDKQNSDGDIEDIENETSLLPSPENNLTLFEQPHLTDNESNIENESQHQILNQDPVSSENFVLDSVQSDPYGFQRDDESGLPLALNQDHNEELALRHFNIALGNLLLARSINDRELDEYIHTRNFNDEPAERVVEIVSRIFQSFSNNPSATPDESHQFRLSNTKTTITKTIEQVVVTNPFGETTNMDCDPTEESSTSMFNVVTTTDNIVEESTTLYTDNIRFVEADQSDGIRYIDDQSGQIMIPPDSTVLVNNICCNSEGPCDFEVSFSHVLKAALGFNGCPCTLKEHFPKMGKEMKTLMEMVREYDKLSLMGNDETDQHQLAVTHGASNSRAIENPTKPNPNIFSQLIKVLKSVCDKSLSKELKELTQGKKVNKFKKPCKNELPLKAIEAKPEIAGTAEEWEHPHSIIPFKSECNNPKQINFELVCEELCKEIPDFRKLLEEKHLKYLTPSVPTPERNTKTEIGSPNKGTVLPCPNTSKHSGKKRASNEASEEEMLMEMDSEDQKFSPRKRGRPRGSQYRFSYLRQRRRRFCQKDSFDRDFAGFSQRDTKIAMFNKRDFDKFLHRLKKKRRQS